MLSTEKNALLTSKQAALFLNVSRSTLFNLRSKKVGPAFYKFGSMVRYKKEDLDAYLSAHLQTPKTTEA